MRKKWSDSEMELVLYFYLMYRDVIGSLEKNNNRLLDFTKRLNFIYKNGRTADSIYMRLQNYKYIDPKYKGMGLSGGANLCQIYWNKYISNVELLEKKYNSFMYKSNGFYNKQDLPLTINKKKWTDFEMKICLYIYLNYDINSLKKNSSLLRNVVYKMNSIMGNKRTLDSIYMRLQNYKYIDPRYNGNGLSGGSNLCRKYWDKYINNKEHLKKCFYEELINNNVESDIIEFEKNVNEIIESIKDDKLLNKDAYIESIINIRNPLFQKHFKNGLNIEFDSKCAICGLDIPELMIASHILPYSRCENKKSMIDTNNGLLLCPVHDALFDKKMISFDINGRIIISKKIEEKMWELIGIDDNCFLEPKILNDERKKYIKLHRKIFEEMEKK